MDNTDSRQSNNNEKTGEAEDEPKLAANNISFAIDGLLNQESISWQGGDHNLELQLGIVAKVKSYAPNSAPPKEPNSGVDKQGDNGFKNSLK